MQSHISRAGRLPLAVALVAVAACVDDQLTTAPRAAHLSRDALDGNVILVTTASGANVPGSLQWAVNLADGTSIIRFDSTLAGDTITLDAPLEPFAFVTIEGPADKGMVLTTTAGQIIRLRQGGTLRNLTFTGGSESPAGAIWTLGPLRLENSTVTNNFANPAIHGHDMTLVNSTVSGNWGSGPAAGISVGSAGTLTLINSTVAHNDGGPGIGWAVTPGGPPLVTLRNSIVAHNESGGRDCEPSMSFAHVAMNISSDSTCGVSPALLIANPQLLALANNGGPTATHALSHLSPALNAGVNCTVAVDQRYVARGTNCDIGAFEFTDFTVVTLSIDANAATAGSPNGAATVTGTVMCSRAGDEFDVVVDLEQQQKSGKTTTVVRGSGSIGVACTNSAQPWSALVTPVAGSFGTGAASAAARTADVPAWTTPATASRTVKLVRPRR